jgi:hypothetical protein
MNVITAKSSRLVTLYLCCCLSIAYPLPKGLFVLDTDTSNVGIGGVLSQVQDNKEKVIVYGSKKLDKQQRYSVTRRELLAVTLRCPCKWSIFPS